MVSYTIEFRHHKLTLTSVTPEDKVIHGVQKLTSALKIKPAFTGDAQLHAIKALQDTIENWAGNKKAHMATDDIPCRTLSTHKN